jgi:hypothetical protein
MRSFSCDNLESMTSGGTAFLVAFPLMMGLIVWVVWSFIKNQTTGDPFITDVNVNPHGVNSQLTSPATRPSRWQSFTFGGLAVLLGVGIFIFAGSISNPLIASSFQTKRTAIGVILLGAWGLYKGARR